MKKWMKQQVGALGRWTLPAFGSATALWALHSPTVAASDDGLVPGAQEVDDPFTFKVQINSNSENLYAGHRSHSSHSSHRSHYSGSGGGGYYSPTYTTPTYSAPTYTAPAYTAPSSNAPTSSGSSKLSGSEPRSNLTGQQTQKTLPPESGAMKDMIFKVQLALQVKGYYKGDLDGTLGPQLRDALQRFQRDKNIASTGTLTTQTLSALGIPLN